MAEFVTRIVRCPINIFPYFFWARIIGFRRQQDAVTCLTPLLLVTLSGQLSPDNGDVARCSPLLSEMWSCKSLSSLLVRTAVFGVTPPMPSLRGKEARASVCRGDWFCHRSSMCAPRPPRERLGCGCPRAGAHLRGFAPLADGGFGVFLRVWGISAGLGHFCGRCHTRPKPHAAIDFISSAVRRF